MLAFFESSQLETYKSGYTGAVCKKVVQEGYGTINLKTKSEKTIFGQEMDSEKYFSKFFDYQYNLLPIKFYETVDTSDIYNLDKIVKEISEMFQILNISLRDANKIFNEFVSKYKIYNKTIYFNCFYNIYTNCSHILDLKQEDNCK